MKCPNCNAENRVNALYCHECGAELEHRPADVRATVELERRTERAKAAARTIRWFLIVSVVLLIAGYYFRAAYKDLPGNDIVAFASPPTVEIDQRVTVTDDAFIKGFGSNFGVKLPRPKDVPVPKALPPDPRIAAELHKAALRSAAVALSQKGRREPIKGFLIGDLVFEVPDPDRKGASKPIHIADVRSLQPRLRGRWEIWARGFKKAIEATIPGAHRLRLQILELGGAGETRSISLSSVTRIAPLRED